MQKNKLLLLALLAIPGSASAEIFDDGFWKALILGIPTTAVAALQLYNMYSAQPRQLSPDEKVQNAELISKLLTLKFEQKMRTGSEREKLESWISTKIADEIVQLTIVDFEIAAVKEQGQEDKGYWDGHDKDIFLARRKEIIDRLTQLESKEYREDQAEQEFRSYVEAARNQKHAAESRPEKQSNAHQSTVSHLRQREQAAAQ